MIWIHYQWLLQSHNNVFRRKTEQVHLSVFAHPYYARNSFHNVKLNHIYKVTTWNHMKKVTFLTVTFMLLAHFSILVLVLITLRYMFGGLPKFCKHYVIITSHDVITSRHQREHLWTYHLSSIAVRYVQKCTLIRWIISQRPNLSHIRPKTILKSLKHTR